MEELEEMKKAFDNLTKSALQLNEMYKKKSKIIEAKDKEIKRLNKIIFELEKYLYRMETDTENCIHYSRSKNEDDEVIKYNRDFNLFDMVLNKLEELKGSDKSGKL